MEFFVLLLLSKNSMKNYALLIGLILLIPSCINSKNLKPAGCLDCPDYLQYPGKVKKK
jgi:hypothetical protein